jgi:hypothetical protein
MSTHWMKERFPIRILVVGAVLWGLAACQTTPPAAETPTATPAPGVATPEIPADAKPYPVVTEESLL